MNLEIAKTLDTPYIFMEHGLIKIEGRSLPENVLKFFAPVKKWLEKYLKKPAEFTLIDLCVPYTNSSSIKQINDFLKDLNKQFLEGYDMKIKWSYDEDDDSVLEIGNDLESMLDIPFEYIITKTLDKQKVRLKVKNKKTGKTGEISQRYWETIKRNGHERDFELLKEI
ncbi:MAG: DUF1987 domain-containing protein [Bacteroidales bacterium]|nr:DUF1987 domain-containing protein [Bacteroidales bacterium]